MRRLLLLLAVLGVLDGGCARRGPPTLVLVSLDTTRADALSCYADEAHWWRDRPAAERPEPATPNIDALAARGVRFAWALAHAPTTLNSHATIFSGLDPHRHRVVRNGYPVPRDFPLLAERLRDAGWQTVAVVGSSALERRMGLDRGFDRYDDPGEAPGGGMYIRGGDEVTDRALAAVDAADPDRPLFLFVHYYDAHTPYFTAPRELVGRFLDPGYRGFFDGSMRTVIEACSRHAVGALADEDIRAIRAMYLAQVAWEDVQVGRLLDGLEERGRLRDALVVVLADHGETHDESRVHPFTHGPNVGLVDLHVPLILRGNGRLALPEGVVVERPVRLQDVATTLLSVVGVGGVLGDGEDLSGLWEGRSWPGPPGFAEATRPIEDESPVAWNNLPLERAVAWNGWLLRANPLDGGTVRLHRVAPGAPVVRDMDVIREGIALLRAWDAAAPPHREPDLDDGTREALEALGYLAPGSAAGAATPPR